MSAWGISLSLPGLPDKFHQFDVMPTVGETFLFEGRSFVIEKIERETTRSGSIRLRAICRATP